MDKKDKLSKEEKLRQAIRKEIIAALSESKTPINENVGAALKSYGDLSSLIKQDEGDIIKGIEAIQQPRRAMIIAEKLNSTFNSLFKLSNQGYDINESKQQLNEAEVDPFKTVTELIGGLNEVKRGLEALMMGNMFPDEQTMSDIKTVGAHVKKAQEMLSTALPRYTDMQPRDEK